MKLFDMEATEDYILDGKYAVKAGTDYVPVSEVKHGRWIPVSERLPEYRKTVLMSTAWGVKTGYLDSTEAYGDFWEIIEDDADTRSVYAWMPLPEPYREEQQQCE